MHASLLRIHAGQRRRCLGLCRRPCGPVCVQGQYVGVATVGVLAPGLRLAEGQAYLGLLDDLRAGSAVGAIRAHPVLARRWRRMRISQICCFRNRKINGRVWVARGRDRLCGLHHNPESVAASGIAALGLGLSGSAGYGLAATDGCRLVTVRARNRHRLSPWA